MRSAPRRAPQIDFDDAIYGVHAVEEALAAEESIRRLYVAAERRRDPALRRLLAAAAQRELPVRFEDAGFFSRFPYKAHQGVVALGAPFGYVTLDEILARRRGAHALVVVLDHITDPHNLGAIIRTAEAVGADGLVIPERRAAGVNATVRKAAAGAASHLPVARVANVADTIRRLKKAHIWVAGAAAGAGAVPLTGADFDRDLALVIGAEGEGLAALVRRECDYLVSVPIVGQVESLNASVAAAVLLYEALRQRNNP